MLESTSGVPVPGSARRVNVQAANGSQDTSSDISAALDLTEKYVFSHGLKGFDPYDALTSPLFRLPGVRSAKVPRWAFQQAVKRLPFQIRPLCGIKKGYNPVTVALVLQGLAYRRCAGRARHSETVPLLLSELRRLSTPGYHGRCWGYDFDWQARYASIPAFHPTIVATGIVTNALYELYRLEASQEAAELVVDSVDFLKRDLNRSEGRDSFCWSYSPTDNQQVLNATMKGARLCAQAYDITGDRSLLELANASIRFVVEAQRADGSWPYSVSDGRSWCDNFHTCYILDCLDAYARLTGDRAFVEAQERGLQFYLDHYFAESGAAGYYHDRLFPVDSTACGQSLLTLCRFRESDRAERLARWCLAKLALPDGAWKYRIHRWGENRLVYMRWSVAWMYLGLSRLELLRAQRVPDEWG